MSNPKNILLECASILAERGIGYGNDIENNFGRIVELFELTTGGRIRPHQAALFLVCVKLARMRTSPEKRDNYIDAINYLAFAASMVEVDLMKDVEEDQRLEDEFDDLLGL